MNPPSLTVVVPTYQRNHLLQMVLKALSGQSDLSRLAEVIVISDGHDPGAASVAQSFSAQLPVSFHAQAKGGVSRARNLGLSLSKADVVLFLDDDVIPSPNLLSEHGRFHRDHPAREDVLLGYVTWHPDVHVTPFMRWYGEYGALFGYGLLADGKRADPRFFYSCNVSLKRAFATEAGGFNERLTVLEDNELGFRLSRLGMNMVFCKNAVGLHYQTFTFKQACSRLERYSPGLPRFLETEAGAALLSRRRRPAFRAAEIISSGLARSLTPLLRWVDSDVSFPNPLYRIFYWHHASKRIFWSNQSKGDIATGPDRPKATWAETGAEDRTVANENGRSAAADPTLPADRP